MVTSSGTAHSSASAPAMREPKPSLTHACTVSDLCANTARQMRKHRAARNVPASTSDRKSTRLNSSHVAISYAVFCLKKKNERRDRASDEAEPGRPVGRGGVPPGGH